MAKQTKPLSEIERTYITLRRNYTNITDKCSVQQEEAFRDVYSAARDAYFEAVKRVLADNSQLVKQLTKELRDANNHVDAELKGLTDIVALLSVATEAVKLAASVAMLAAA